MESEKWLRYYTWGTWVMAIFTIVIAGATIQQCRMNRDSERPWLGPVQRTLTMGEAHRVKNFQWHYRNGGKSPAIDVRFSLFLKLGDPLPNDLLTMKAPVIAPCERTQPLPEDQSSLALPGINYTFQSPPPQDVIDSNESLVANRLGLYFVGCVDYRSTSGINYRTWVCEYYHPEMEMFYACVRGNSAQ